MVSSARSDAPIGALTLLRWLPAVGWAALIWWASSRPSGGATPSLAFAAAWNAAHFVAFSVLAALVWWAVGRGARGRALAISAAVAFYGVADEIHQLFVPGRCGSAWDVLTDASGALFATACLERLRGHRRAVARAVVACATGVLGVLGATLA